MDVPQAGEVIITGVSNDSRTVKDFKGGAGNSGPIFAAVPGDHVDGHDFIEEAVADGAVCVLSERRMTGVDVPQLVVKDARKALAVVSAVFYGEPTMHMTVVGVTGTNGKTTTAYIIESIFKAAGFNTGVIGTVNYRFGGRTLPASHTTPESPELQRTLKEMRDSGVTHCVMEVSSHALAQGRVDGCRFDAAVFTNLTHEHLDYHHTMEDYFRAKSLLYGLLKDGVEGRAIVNVDDPWGRKLVKGLDAPLTYGLKSGPGVYPMDYTVAADGTRAEVHTPRWGVIKLSTPLIGEYNLQNVLASVAATSALGVGPDAIREGVEGLKRVPGRLEKVEASGTIGFTGYVDYAHTGDALQRALCELNRIIEGEGRRIITVFGCGGDRDRTKRPEMGRAAVANSSLTIITSDNPRSEDPFSIIEGIEEGVRGLQGVKRYFPGDTAESINGKGYMVVPERGEAIRKAVSLADDGDVILVAGKGHEDYQIVKGVRHHFDDLETIKEAMLARPDIVELIQ